MAINGGNFSSVSTKQEFTVCLQVTRVPPVPGEIIDPPVAPGILIGYYNEASDKVFLYIANEIGTQLIKVG